MDVSLIKFGDVNIDTRGFSKPLCKLIDTIKAPFSWAAKRIEPLIDARVDAGALRIKVAEADKLEKEFSIPREDAMLATRAIDRDLYDKMRQQRNLEAIVIEAARMLPETVSDEPVNEDWTAEFFDQCKNVSDEDMQSLWARILAGEVTEPGSFPKRVLNFVHQMSKEEATLFTNFCRFVWKGENIEGLEYFHIRLQRPAQELLPNQAGLHVYELTALDSLGLITHFPPNLLRYLPSRNSYRLCFGRNIYLLNRHASVKRANEFEIIPVSSLGSKLVPICGAEPDEKYKERILFDLRQFYDVTPVPSGP